MMYASCLRTQGRVPSGMLKDTPESLNCLIEANWCNSTDAQFQRMGILLSWVFCWMSISNLCYNGHQQNLEFPFFEKLSCCYPIYFLYIEVWSDGKAQMMHWWAHCYECCPDMKWIGVWVLIYNFKEWELCWAGFSVDCLFAICVKMGIIST